MNEINETKDISQILFINAWDSWSILGNGNTGDNSWDDEYGRKTVISVLALPQINQYMKYIDLIKCN